MSTILVALALVYRMGAQSPEPQQVNASDRPLWTINLRQFGYERWLRKNTRQFPVGVDFTDSDHIAVAWTMPDPPKEARKVGPVVPEPAHLNVLIFDAKTGQKRNGAEWPTSAHYFSKPLFFGTAEGNLLTCSDNHLRLLSPSLVVLREMQLPNRAGCVNINLMYSPSRRTALVSFPLEHSRQQELLDVETLGVLLSWADERAAKAKPNGIMSIADGWAVGYCGKQSELCLRRTGGDWQPFHLGSSNMQTPANQNMSAWFVNENTLFTVAQRNIAALAKLDGAVLFRITAPREYVLQPPVTSSGGSRFAVIEDRFRGLGNEALDMYPFTANDRAFVYSNKDRRSIFSVKLKGTSPWSPWDVHENYLALSPNGSLIALLSDGVLSIYSLPSEETDQH